jgi:hypothetical protein
MTKITIELNKELAQKIEEGINKMNKTLKIYEEKYNMSSVLFYDKFDKGEVDDSADFMIWAGVYEIKE